MKRRLSNFLLLLVAAVLALAHAPTRVEAAASSSTGVLSGLTALSEDRGLTPQATVTATYLNKDGSTASRGDARQVSSSMHTLEGGWWIVDNDMTISQRLDIKGDTNLILKDGVTFTANAGICIQSASSLTIWAQSASKGTAGKLNARSESYSALGGNPKTTGGRLVINGGVIRAEGGYKSAGIGGSDEGNITSLEVNGGFVEAYGWNKDMGDKRQFDAGAGIGGGYHGDGFPVTINGGTVYAKGGFGASGIGGGQGNGGNGCTINGGTVTAIGGEQGAGIGGGNSGRSQGVTITGGTVTAEGGERGAGIGSGNDADCDGISIKGGNVTAIGGVYGAGIGGGREGESTQIWISGGTVVAKAKSPRMGWGTGAAIGGGFGADFSSEMIVSGGDVTAIGARGGAGIGAGAKANMTGSLKVTGGIVRAYGGASATPGVDQNANRGAAGIGGGEEIDNKHGGEGGTVIIEGGTVIAYGGGGYHCAIGHGFEDSVIGTVSIEDDMWTRWTNTVTLGTQQKDNTFTAPTVKESDLTPSWTDRRVYDSQYMRYVIIEKCQHTGGTEYIDSATSEHTINFDCRYCKTGRPGAVAPHDFKNNHTCVCGHKEHAVTFYNEDGSVYKAEDYYVAGTAMGRPKNPTKDGYTFEGWFEKNGNEYVGKAYNFYVPVSRDLKLYAKWIEEAPSLAAYTVKFVFSTQSPEHGDSEEVSVTAGSVIEPNQIPQNPEQPGKKFLGWFESDATHPFDFEQPITSDVELHDRWANLYTVAFNTQAADATQIPSQTVAHGERVSRTGIVPTRSADGSEWLFAGWFKEAACANPYDFSTPVTSDLTLYAKWVAREQNVYVKLDPNGGALASGTEGFQTVTKGQKATAPTEPPTHEGATFGGWKLNGEDYDWNSPVTQDITLVASWERWVTVSFDSAGGSDVGAKRLLSGSTIAKPADPTREGFVFVGWYQDQRDDSEPWKFDEYEVMDDLTLTAHWKTIKHTVSFDSNGGTGVESQEVDEGTKAARPADPTREGWRFAGWYLSGSSYGFDTPVKTDIQLTARWTKLCMVRYDSSGGTTVAPVRVPSGTKLTEPAKPTREGREFLGWYVDAGDGTSVEWDFDDVVEDDMVLSAWWLLDTFTVKFDTQGGSEVPSQEVSYGDRVRKNELVEPTRETDIFAGWFTTPECTVPYDFSTRVKGDLTVYAKWVARIPETYAVIFDTDGGSYVEPRQLGENDELKRTESDPTRENYTFLDWYEVVEGNISDTPFEFGGVVKKDTTLRALWKPREHTTSFNLNYDGAPEPPASQDVPHDELAQEPPMPEREGHLFLGWFKKNEAGELLSYDFDEPVLEDLVLYADWLEVGDVYLVVFDSQGGTDVEAQVVLEGDKVAEPAVPEREGYVFTGWFSDPEAEEPYDFSRTITAELTLYAGWKVNTPAPNTPAPTPGTVTGIVSVTDGSWKVSSTNIGEVARTVLTRDELAAVEAGADATLKLSATPLADPPAADREAAAALLETLGASEGSWNDLTLTLSVKGLPDRTITEVSVPIRLSVEVPDDLRADGRTFWLIRCHGEEPEVVATGTEDVLDGESALFSSWLVAYRDEEASTPSPTPEPDPAPTPAPAQQRSSSTSTKTSSPAPAATRAALPATGDAGTAGLAPLALLGILIIHWATTIRRAITNRRDSRG